MRNRNYWLWPLVTAFLVVGAIQAASPVFGPGSGSAVPGVLLQERDKAQLTPKERAVIWDKTDGPVAGRSGSWQKLLGATPTAHAATHKVNGADSVGAATTSTAGLVKLGTTTSTACEGNDGRLTNARTPSAHQAGHRLGGADALPRSSTSTAGLAEFAPSGAVSPTYAVEANDSRLSNARDPNAHETTHQLGGIDPLPAASTSTAGLVTLAADAESSGSKATAANDTRLSNNRTPTAHEASHRHGGGDALPDATTATYGLAVLATDGESDATKAAVSNDSRFTNARTPSAHEASHLYGSTDGLPAASTSTHGLTILAESGAASASYAVDAADPRLSDARVPLTHGSAHAGGAADPVPAATTATAGIVQLAPNGAGSQGQAVQPIDDRLFDARTPTAHATTHAIGATDAMPAASTTTAGLQSVADFTFSASMLANFRSGQGTISSGNDVSITFGTPTDVTPVLILTALGNAAIPMSATNVSTTVFNAHSGNHSGSLSFFWVNVPLHDPTP